MRWLGLRGLVLAAFHGGIAFSFQAVSLLGIAEVQVVQTSTPVLAAIYARVLLGEPWLRLEQCAAVVASIGVALQFGGHHQTHGSDHAAGLAFALAGAASAGGVYVLVRYLGTVVVKVDWPILMLYQACGQMLLAFPAHVALARRRHPHGVFTAISTVTTRLRLRWDFLSQILMTRGMQRVKSASASIARLSGLPWSFLFQAVFTSDPVRGRTVAGALIVVASMGFVVHAARLKSARPRRRCWSSCRRTRRSAPTTTTSTAASPIPNGGVFFVVYGATTWQFAGVFTRSGRQAGRVDILRAVRTARSVDVTARVDCRCA